MNMQNTYAFFWKRLGMLDDFEQLYMYYVWFGVC